MLPEDLGSPVHDLYTCSLGSMAHAHHTAAQAAMPLTRAAGRVGLPPPLLGATQVSQTKMARQWQHEQVTYAVAGIPVVDARDAAEGVRPRVVPKVPGGAEHVVEAVHGHALIGPVVHRVAAVAA